VLVIRFCKWHGNDTYKVELGSVWDVTAIPSAKAMSASDTLCVWVNDVSLQPGTQHWIAFGFVHLGTWSGF